MSKAKTTAAPSFTGDDGFVEVGAPADITYLKFDEMTAGHTIEGRYVGTIKSARYDRLTYKIDTKNGLIGLNSAAQLDSKFAEIPLGSSVRIVYLGKKLMKTGNYAGKEAHSFRVFSRNDGGAVPTLAAAKPARTVEDDEDDAY